MLTPQHMKLAERKAFALLAAYLQSVEPGEPITKGTLGLVYDAVRGYAKLATEGMAGANMEAFLESAFKGVSNLVAELPESPQPAAVTRTMLRLQQRLLSPRCEVCAGGAACNGKPTSDDSVVSAPEGGVCVNEIRQAFDLAVRLTHRAVPPDILPLDRRPTVTLWTSELQRRPNQLPGFEIAVGGGTRYEDTANRHYSHVKIKVAALHLDRLSLTVLPYVALHEVFCHGFQMAMRPGPRENKQGIVDPISEGMMDELAVEVLEAEAERLRQDPNLAAAARDLAEEARAIHIARASLVREPMFEEAPEVRLGVETLRELRDVLGSETKSDTVRRLAFTLNVAAWSFDERLNGLSKLLGALRRRPLDAAVVDALLQFEELSDSQPLFAFLKNS